jgi:hypothetical protein
VNETEREGICGNKRKRHGPHGSPNAGKGMLYAEVELRRQRRKKNVVVLPKSVGQVVSQGGDRHDMKEYTKENKKRTMETR